MAVKTFTAGSMQAAVAKVKESIGDDAIILSTRRIPVGVNNPYGRDIFEVDAEKPSAGNTESMFTEAPPARKSGVDSRSGRDITEEGDPKEGWAAVQSELAVLKELMLLSQQAEEERQILRNPETHSIFTTLLRAGVSDSRARQVVARAEERLASQAGGEEVPPDTIGREVLSLLVGQVKVADPFGLSGRPPEGRGRQVAAFVGPTGSGKTTTIAKLAAELFLKQGRKVGLISVDSYRIGAIDQLKTYASIMGIPFVPAFSREDLVSALSKLERCEVILVDTAGQSHLDTPRMEELETILGSGVPLSVHLVVSAVTGRLDAREVVQRFSVLGPETLVFTKVDETRRAASIFDTMAEARLPLSLITNGQRVPEDLVVADKKSVLGLVLSNPSQKTDMEQ
ncbi:flagellar biosynthesis protein FlhF [Desulfoluna spongiiphila]|uniref:Flagellar biosynthesis protein FlhF n=1 Tax=Desulfoluna spongiiphila TaxID=419481 RepID=A0A1G5AJK2_9BACT|nr:flagellar biosynthesis protein FlhF [Desulfoluna spongiiphila]SCX78098.1 flagellar biosynthesis protein FlhF [Desulfoluna spongiiphila]VVS90532.1 flagellar biosynthesis protein flhf [Desulfoluna spongiiphila]